MQFYSEERLTNLYPSPTLLNSVMDELFSQSFVVKSPSTIFIITGPESLTSLIFAMGEDKLVITNVLPETTRAAADKGKLENVLEETFDVSSEHNNLRTRIKHFYLEIKLTCPKMKSY